MTQNYEFFEITNPQEYRYGFQPQVRSVGTVVMSETRTTIGAITEFNVTTFENRTETMLDFTQRVDMDITSGNDILNMEIETPNPEVFAQLAAYRDATPWHVAIRALKQIVDFTYLEYYPRAIVGELIGRDDTYVNEQSFVTKRGAPFITSGKTVQQVVDMFLDQRYGFGDTDNIRIWVESCNANNDGYNRKLLMDFFNITNGAMNDFMTQLCKDWDTARTTVNSYGCVTTDCSPHGIFYEQWASSRLSYNIFGTNSMDHLRDVNGHPEMSVFLPEVFFEGASDSFKEQFATVDFKTRKSESEFARIFSPTELFGSLYNFTNVKLMFEIGAKVDEISTAAKIDYSGFEELTRIMTTIDNREAYVLYRYLRHLAENTYLQGRSADVAQFSTATAPLMKNEIKNFVIEFGSEYLGQALFRFFNHNTCQEAFLRLFPTKSGNSNRVCSSPKTAPNTLEGLRFWMRLYIGRTRADDAMLQDITSYTLKDFQNEFDESSSNFSRHIHALMTSFTLGRQEKDICNQDFNELCSVYELGINQWLTSEFTMNLPMIFQGFVTPQYSWVDTFRSTENSTILKSEINYLDRIQARFTPHNISLHDVFTEFRPHRLFEPLFFMSFLRKEDLVDTPFDDNSFYAYISLIYKNRNFPSLTVRKTINLLLQGEPSTYLTNLQRAPLAQNGNPMIQTSHRVMRYPQMKDNIVHWQILAGHVNEYTIRRVHTLNNPAFTYAVANRTFWHQDIFASKTGVRYYPTEPWTQTVHLASGSDSIQYQRNIKSTTNLFYYNPLLRAQVDLSFVGRSIVYKMRALRYRQGNGLFRLSMPDERANIYHNYVYDDSFNTTAVSGSSMYITMPLFSNFGHAMKPKAAVMMREGENVEFTTGNDTTIDIERYSGFTLNSKQAYQYNYIFDTYGLERESKVYFLPSHSVSINLLIGEDFAIGYFSAIRNLMYRRRVIMAVCLSIGITLFLIGLSAWSIYCKRRQDKKNKDDEEFEMIKAARAAKLNERTMETNTSLN